MKNGTVARHVLFVCARGACRSPMALGFARAFGLPHWRFENGALDPLARVDPLASYVMRAEGIDIGELRGRRLSRPALRRADLVVLIAVDGEPIGPMPLVPNLVRWEVDDPLGWPIDVYEDARVELRRLVLQLLAWLEREATDAPLWLPRRPFTVAEA